MLSEDDRLSISNEKACFWNKGVTPRICKQYSLRMVNVSVWYSICGGYTEDHVISNKRNHSNSNQ